MRHKHADIIHAWAEGAKVQFKDTAGRWLDLEIEFPAWDAKEYRIKPEKKPDVVCYARISKNGGGCSWHTAIPIEDSGGELKLTFDGETGQLKSAEVLNANT